MYDYLVLGFGLYGVIFAYEASSKGKSVLVIYKHPNFAGNVYTEDVEGTNVHVYGAHVFLYCQYLWAHFCRAVPLPLKLYFQ